MWVRREDNSMHPPLALVGEVILVHDGYAFTDVAYTRHRCRDEDVLLWEKVKTSKRAEKTEKEEQRTERRAEQRALLKQMASARDIAWEQARPRSCPKCGAEPNEACENLTKRAQGIAAETSWPHPERLIEPTEETQHETDL
jgi:hypothetical protein